VESVPPGSLVDEQAGQARRERLVSAHVECARCGRPIQPDDKVDIVEAKVGSPLIVVHVNCKDPS
jgi:hypothetical protein